MEELNRKIAEWCGFVNPRIGEEDIIYEGRVVELWVNNLSCPLFTTSLDACFEYIVPKLVDDVRFSLWPEGQWYVELIMNEHTRTKLLACGNKDCCASSNIAGHASFGSGELDDYGFWEKSCFICARSYETATRKTAWPYTDEYIATMGIDRLQEIIKKV